MANQNSSEKTAFVICISNEKYPAALERWKVYRVLANEKAAKHNYIRVVDESGEDYLYPSAYFVPIRIPLAVKKALLAAAK